jgi:hypothetical protein
MAAPRPHGQRRADALAILTAPAADAWVATASASGGAYLVPLSIGWTGDSVVLVTLRRSPTAHNLRSAPGVRLGLGGTRDVVLIDGDVITIADLETAPDALVDAFAAQSGWDPRQDSNAADYQVFEVRPVQLQAWREANELRGRTLLRDGEWLDDPSMTGG